MTFYLLSSLVILQLGSMQYIGCVSSKGRRLLGKSIHILGVVCTLAFCAFFIAGFIFSEWWVPLAALFVGLAVGHLVPSKARQPELIYFTAVLSVPLVIMSIEAM
ncbi:hypothetical protein [Marinimicrobium koreense]|uniref:hypothetical protein n=1 Tax=Marinimicrobium koreense TaxID=306545 RepID=UPI000F4CC0D3|nr:hypothetical protein [Marinimicrobium koreense]